MITLDAYIVNAQFGGYRWFAFVRYERKPPNRGRSIGKLESNFGGFTVATCRRQIEKAAKRMSGAVLSIDLDEHEILLDGSLGKIMHSETLFKAAK